MLAALRTTGPSKTKNTSTSWAQGFGSEPEGDSLQGNHQLDVFSFPGHEINREPTPDILVGQKSPPNPDVHFGSRVPNKKSSFPASVAASERSARLLRGPHSAETCAFAHGANNLRRTIGLSDFSPVPGCCQQHGGIQTCFLFFGVPPPSHVSLS